MMRVNDRIQAGQTGIERGIHCFQNGGNSLKTERKLLENFETCN